MSNFVQPNPLVAAVAFVEPVPVAAYVEACAAVSYPAVRADVLVIGEAFGAQFVDAALMTEYLALTVRKPLADSEIMTDSVSVSFFTGSVLNGAELDGVELNG